MYTNVGPETCTVTSARHQYIPDNADVSSCSAWSFRSELHKMLQHPLRSTEVYPEERLATVKVACTGTKGKTLVLKLKANNVGPEPSCYAVLTSHLPSSIALALASSKDPWNKSSAGALNKLANPCVGVPQACVNACLVFQVVVHKLLAQSQLHVA